MNTIDTEWLTAARDLLATATRAGSQVVGLEKDCERVAIDVDTSRANLSARALHYRLDKLRAEAKHAQATGAGLDTLKELTYDLRDVEILALEERKLLKEQPAA